MGNVVVTPMHFGIAFAVLVLVLAACGAAQQREARASRGRLWRAAVLLTLCVLAPAVPALILGEQLDLSWFESDIVLESDDLPWLSEDKRQLVKRIEDPVAGVYYTLPAGAPIDVRGAGYAGLDRPVQLLVVLLAIFVLLRVIVSTLRPVGYALGVREELPELQDEDCVEGLRELSRGFGLEAPRMLELKSSCGAPVACAWAGGVVGPVLIVGDGISGRFSGADTRAVVAHEMAHVARRSVAKTIVLYSLGLTGIVALSAWLFPSIAFAFVLFGLFFAAIYWSRHDERASDLLAARLIGFDAMASGLDRIHAANRLPCGGALRRWFFALATHPAEVTRRAWLALHAPEDERAELGCDRAELAQQRFADRTVLGLALLAVALGVWGGLDADFTGIGIVALLALVVVRFASTVLVQARLLWWLWQLGYWRMPLAWLGPWLVLVVLVFVGFAGWDGRIAGSVLTLLSLYMVWVVVRHRRRRRDIDAARRMRNLRAALDALSQQPQAVWKQPATQVERAQLLAGLRREAEGIGVLEDVITQSPRYWPAQLQMCSLCSPRDPAKALSHADTVIAALPHNPFPVTHRAQALARLGRQPEAEASMRQLAEREPNIHAFALTLADVASHGDDLEVAKQEIQRAETLNPGDPGLELARARVALKAHDYEAACEAIARAEAALDKDPLLLFGPAIDQLIERLPEEVALRRGRGQGVDREAAG